MATLAAGNRPRVHPRRPARQEGEAQRLQGQEGRRLLLPEGRHARLHHAVVQLRDAEPDLKKLKAVVLGISPDPPEKQLKFDEKYDLGFTLLADTEHAVAEKYGVWGEKMNYGRKYMGIIRSAFVIDETGKIAAAFYKVSPKDTVPKVTKVLNT